MNDKEYKDIQKAIEEIHSGKKESAAALTLETGKTRLSFPRFRGLFKFRFMMFIIILCLLIGIGTVTYMKLFSGSSDNLNATTIVEQVQELSTLTTAEAVVTTVIKEQDNKLFNQKININLPGTKRVALLIVPATVIAGVDLKSLSDKNIQINDQKKEITLTIPHATVIQEPSIQMDKIQTYSEEGIFRNDVNWNEGFDLASLADKQIKKEAVSMGLLSKADDSAKKALSHFYGVLGYKTIINFQ